MNPFLRTLSFAACLFLGCGFSDPDPGNGTGTGTGTPTGPGDSTRCPAPGGPTIHEKDILADETWTAAGSPHLVQLSVTVREGAKLTIERCAEVRLAEGVSLVAGEGRIVANGTADGRILFTSEGEGRWEALEVRAAGSLYLAHATLENGGRTSINNTYGATIRGLGQDSSFPRARIEVHQVTIRNSFGLGIELNGTMSFVPGSEGLTITGSGAGGGDEWSQYPLTINAPGLHLIPPGSYTGNGRDEILVYTWEPVENAVTVRDVGVAYRVTPHPGPTLDVYGSNALGVLTLEAGVIMRFDPGTRINVGSALSGQADGAIRLMGTAQKPVTLTSASDTPAPGDWVGIDFGGEYTALENHIEYARIEYAGGYANAGVGYGCNPPGSGGQAALLFLTSYATSAFMVNSVVAHSAGHAVERGWRIDQSTVSFKDTNAFENIAHCIETPLRDEYNHCPDPVLCE